MANEKRLIDANALMDEFRNYMVERHDRIKCASEENCKVCENGCLWREVVSKAPTVDSVEVVRCEHCTHSLSDGWICGGPSFTMPSHPTYPDAFCSYGERRTDEPN